MIRRRKPIARSGLASVTPIRRRPAVVRGRSERALAKLPERARVVDEVWDRDRGQCRAAQIITAYTMGRFIMPIEMAAAAAMQLVPCAGRLDPHEIIPRSAWPGGELVVDNVVLICRNHHRWVGDHPSMAHAVGLHGFSWERPDG